MIFESIICSLGIVFTIPAIVSESSDLNFKAFHAVIHLLPQVLLILALLCRLRSGLHIGSIFLGGVSTIGTYSLLIFNTQSSSYAICKEFSNICAIEEEIICEGVIPKPWEAILYIIGLCFMLIGTTVLLRNTSRVLKGLKVGPDSNRNN